MTTKHAPAPWCYNSETEQILDANGQVVIWETGTNAADIRLLAAAPELLAALQDCVSFRNWELAEGGVTPAEFVDTFKRAEGAIAKALGAL